MYCPITLQWSGAKIDAIMDVGQIVYSMVGYYGSVESHPAIRDSLKVSQYGK